MFKSKRNVKRCVLTKQLAPTLLCSVAIAQDQFDDNEAESHDPRVDRLIERESKVLLDQKKHWV